MDVDRVKGELQRFLAMEALYQEHRNQFSVAGSLGPGPISEADLGYSAQIVEQILDRVMPTWRGNGKVSSYDRWMFHTRGCNRAIAQLTKGAELEEMLGDSSPTLQASGLHVWVWEAARSLWQSGHYREAVGAAATKVNAELQNKLGRRDRSEADLFNQAFTDDPPKPGAPRLRLPGDTVGKTDKSRRRGVRCFAEGCYAALRNPMSHELGELPEPEALEQLAAFSILARWADSAEVVTEGLA